jgi:hypothetical protein
MTETAHPAGESIEDEAPRAESPAGPDQGHLDDLDDDADADGIGISLAY